MISLSFKKFLAKSFANKSTKKFKASLLLEFYLASLQKGEIAKYSDFSKRTDNHVLSILSPSTISTYHKELYRRGFLFEVTLPSGEKKRILTHPMVLFWIAKMKNGQTIGDFKQDLEKLLEMWNNHFNNTIKAPCVIPVEGWTTYAAFGNTIGWMYFLSDELRNGMIILLTPHLRLLSEPWREALEDFQKRYRVKFRFLCEKPLPENIDREFFERNEFVILSPEIRSTKRYRAAVFIDSQNTPISGFEAIKQDGKYVGVLYWKSEEDLKELKRLLDIYTKYGEIVK